MIDRRAVWNLSKARPSTAPVGNDALMAALRQLGAERGEDVAVWKFMSAGQPHKPNGQTSNSVLSLLLQTEAEPIMARQCCPATEASF